MAASQPVTPNRQSVSPHNDTETFLIAVSEHSVVVVPSFQACQLSTLSSDPTTACSPQNDKEHDVDVRGRLVVPPVRIPY